MSELESWGLLSISDGLLLVASWERVFCMPLMTVNYVIITLDFRN